MKKNSISTLSIVPNNGDNNDRANKGSHHGGVKYYLKSTTSNDSVEIPMFPFIIGRASTSDLILRDKNVSRKHAIVSKKNDSIIIENNGSLNGVRVNRNKVERVVLSHGDQIQIAGVKFVFQAKDKNPAKGASNTAPPSSELDIFGSPEASNDDLANEALINKSLVNTGLAKDVQNNDEGDAQAFEDEPPHSEDEIREALLESEGGGTKKFYLLALSMLTFAIAISFFMFLQEEPDLSRAIYDVKAPESDAPAATGTIAGTNQKKTRLFTGELENKPEQIPVDNTDINRETHLPEQQLSVEATRSTTPAVKQGIDTQNTTDSGNKLAALEQTEAIIPDSDLEIGVDGTTTSDKQPAQVNESQPTKAVEVEKPVVVKQQAKAPVEVKKPTKVAVVAKPKPVTVKYTKFSRATSESRLRQAQSLYISGNYHISQDRLKAIYNGNKHRQEYRQRARTLSDKLRNLNAIYTRGQTQYGRDQKQLAFKTWSDFLKQERKVFPGKTSQYSRNVKDTVAIEFETKGRLAFAENDWKNAYRYWQRALKIRKKHEIVAAINQMDNQIASLYRKGVSFQKSDRAQAIEYWNRVINKAPIDHEYYLKAKAKINWLKNSRVKAKPAEQEFELEHF